MKKIKTLFKKKEHTAFFILCSILFTIGGFIALLTTYPVLVNYVLLGLMVVCSLGLLFAIYQLILLAL